MNKLLTIIVPVYKVEPYINKCLDSLIIAPELMELMDVLIINDGTPDNSAEMSREYVRRYPSVFRQIDKENGGHGSAWNLGIKEAFGKYVKFLDSDDWLENLEPMMRKLSASDADLVITSVICHNANEELWKLEIKDMEFDKVYDADCFDWLGNRSHGNYIFHHCAIYKAEMFRQYLPLFLEHQPYDDVILGAAPIIGAKTLVAWDMEVYQYRMDRPGQSISAEVERKNVGALVKVLQSTIDFIEKHPISDHTSTKYVYFKVKLPKKYSYGYKSFFEVLSTDEVRGVIKDWDNWIRERDTDIVTMWMRIYRLLPWRFYQLFWEIYKTSVRLYRKVR